jgi:uncharacterized peroxidase-related enzyme
MSRITRLEKHEVSAEAQAVYEKAAAARGNVPNMYRVFAHRPELLTTMNAHLNAVTTSGTVPLRTKELVASLVSRINLCDYWNRSHTAQAARHGATTEQLDELLNFEHGPFDERERAALSYARQLTVDAHGVDDDMMQRLRSSYDEGEIVEITAMAGIFNYLNRVANALHIEPTKPGEGLWSEASSSSWRY